MTTIFSDGKSICADSRGVKGSSINHTPTRKIRLVKGKVFGIAGTYVYFEPMIDWYIGGRDPKKKPSMTDKVKDEFYFCVFWEDCVEVYDETCVYAELHGYPYTVGSGANFARGAMLAAPNMKLPDVLALVETCDLYTDGAAVVLAVPSAKYTKPFAPKTKRSSQHKRKVRKHEK